jgi:hypothetical protein
MPCLKCVNILENYLVCNMFYGFDVCIVQSTWKRRNIFNNLFAISSVFRKKEDILLYSLHVFQRETHFLGYLYNLVGYKLNQDIIMLR